MMVKGTGYKTVLQQDIKSICSSWRKFSTHSERKGI